MIQTFTNNVESFEICSVKIPCDESEEVQHLLEIQVKVLACTRMSPVSQFQECREWTCVLVETSLARLPWKNATRKDTRTQNSFLERIEMYCVLA